MSSKKQAFAPAISTASAVTQPVTGPSPVVTVVPRSSVQGPDGQVRITQSFGPPRPAKQRKIVKVFGTAEMMQIGRMHAVMRTMFAIMERLPPVRQRELKSQLGAITLSGDEPDDGAASSPPRSKPPSALEITFMDAAFEALMFEWRNDVDSAKLVIGRALGAPWRRLMQEDPKRRCRAALAFERNNCLWRLAHTMPGRRALDVYQIVVDKVDKKAQ